MDLGTMIMKNMCECMNECDDNNFENCLNNGPTFLSSDVDEQLIISVTFNQAVKIHSLKIKAPAKNGPKKIRLFINQPITMDFDKAESAISIQDLSVTPRELEGTNLINLRFVKFQNVQNIQLFVETNQSGDEKTIIENLCFIGSPIITTKMDDFKRISGKKGEAH